MRQLSASSPPPHRARGVPQAAPGGPRPTAPAGGPKAEPEAQRLHRRPASRHHIRRIRVPRDRQQGAVKGLVRCHRHLGIAGARRRLELGIDRSQRLSVGQAAADILSRTRGLRLTDQSLEVGDDPPRLAAQPLSGDGLGAAASALPRRLAAPLQPSGVRAPGRCGTPAARGSLTCDPPSSASVNPRPPPARRPAP
jgi:hypothetical protein